jgi:hypothetical protein
MLVENRWYSSRSRNGLVLDSRISSLGSPTQDREEIGGGGGSGNTNALGPDLKEASAALKKVHRDSELIRKVQALVTTWTFKLDS